MRNCSIPQEIFQVNLCHRHNLAFTRKNLWLTPALKLIFHETECSRSNKEKGNCRPSLTYLFLCHWFFNPFLFNYETLLQLQVLFILPLLLFFLRLPFFLFLDRKDDKWSVCSFPSQVWSEAASSLSAASTKKVSKMSPSCPLDGTTSLTSHPRGSDHLTPSAGFHSKAGSSQGWQRAENHS